MQKNSVQWHKFQVVQNRRKSKRAGNGRRTKREGNEGRGGEVKESTRSKGERYLSRQDGDSAVSEATESRTSGKGVGPGRRAVAEGHMSEDGTEVNPRMITGPYM